jgi:hypothetical protein
MEVTQDDFDGWKNHHVTREVFKILEERKNKIAHGLAQGGALGIPNNAILVGRYKEIDDLITMTFQDMQPVKEEEVWEDSTVSTR